MSLDSYIQVAVDSTGKKVAMDQGLDAAGNTIYFQKALLIGDPADAIAQNLQIQIQQLAVLRAILAVLTQTSNSQAAEEDFPPL